MIIQDISTNNPYQGYAYSYPHKTAYREFSQPLLLQDIWKNENKSSVFLYLHIPFCEMRCGFCNLFTMANPEEDLIQRYLKALKMQAEVVQESVGQMEYSQLAIGGGTPSFLNLSELETLFEIVEVTMGAKLNKIPSSFEVSPKTVTSEKLLYLKQKGIKRISIGVQSFLEDESKLLGRPQRNIEVDAALRAIRDHKFESFNIDLIYGGATQNPVTWNETLTRALEYQPGEIFLYPLYVRPLTGLDKIGTTWDNFRLKLYRQGRDLLLSNGYEQISMRMFRRPSRERIVTTSSYCCQEDGMLGLGSGARSYTTDVHYSAEYAVGRKGVKSIINAFVNENSECFSKVGYGIMLSHAEKKRRYVIKSLLHKEGLDVVKYNTLFEVEPFEEFPILKDLIDNGHAQMNGGILNLTSTGIELSDSIGPALYSDNVKQLMNQYQLR